MRHHFFPLSRKGFHTIEYVVLFSVIVVSVVGAMRLIKGSWNARMDFDSHIHDSFYDPMKPGVIELSDECSCTTPWTTLDECGLAECGDCEKLMFRACTPLGCAPDGDADGALTRKCEQSGKCDGKSDAGCGTDPDLEENYADLCPWGTHVQSNLDCANPIEDKTCDDCPPTYAEKIDCIGDTACEFTCGGINFDINADGILDNPAIYVPCDDSSNQAPTQNFPSTVGGSDDCNGGPCQFTCGQSYDGISLEAHGAYCDCPKTEPQQLEFDEKTLKCVCPDTDDTCSGIPAICSPSDCDPTFCETTGEIVDCNPSPDIHEPCFDCVGSGSSCGDFSTDDCPAPCEVKAGSPGVCDEPVDPSGGGGECVSVGGTLCNDAGLCDPNVTSCYAFPECPGAIGCQITACEICSDTAGTPYGATWVCTGSYDCSILGPGQCGGYPGFCKWVE